MRSPRATLTLAIFLCTAALFVFLPSQKDKSAQEWRIPFWTSLETYDHARGLKVGVVEVTAHHDGAPSPWSLVGKQQLIPEVIGSVLTVLRDLEADTTLYRTSRACGLAHSQDEPWRAHGTDSQDRGRSCTALIRLWRTCIPTRLRRTGTSKSG
jgi:hypothetical protein